MKPNIELFQQVGEAAIKAKQDSQKWIPITPHEKQQLFLDQLDLRECLFGGATGGGKTIALLADAAQHVEVPHYSALLLRRNFPDLEQEGGLMDVSKLWWGSNSGAEWSERRREWTFPSGATIRFGFMSTENDKYRYAGGEYQYIGYDELTQFPESQYNFLFSRLRRKAELADKVPLRIRGATNPGGIGGRWVYERFIPDDFTAEKAKKTKIWYKKLDNGQRVGFIPSLLSDNPSVDYESYMESLQNLDPITRAQYIKGDWMIQIAGDIFYMYSEPHTVISWKEFEKVFGTRHIPYHWLIEMYQDWGTTKEHPCVTTWFTTAAENAPTVNGVNMAGTVFLYRGLTMEQATARQVGQMLLEIMAPHGERARLRRFEMSHEASSERMEYLNMGLPATNWDTGITRGIEQTKAALTLVDEDKPHPFFPSLNGHPRLFLISDEDGLVNPKTDAHLVRHRAEIFAYKWAELKSGEPMTKLVPHALFNDAVDTIRAAAANYFPYSAERTVDELIEKRVSELVSPGGEWTEAKDISFQMARLMAVRELRQKGYVLDEFGKEVEGPADYEFLSDEEGW